MDERTKAIISATVILVVEGAALFGVSIDQSRLGTVLMAAASLAATFYGIYKNHNFSPEAAKAQEYLDMLKGKE